VERVYVEQSVKEVFEAKCLDKIKTWTMGDGMDPSSKVSRTKLLPKLNQNLD
jgi:acyl-CoA reductase-like NAD-dependent aldehyde dehydrogenase